MKKVFFLFAVIWVWGSFASAQEKLIEISSDVLIKEAYQKSLKNKAIKTKGQTSLTLPFLEDFSNYTGYPSESLWLDEHAFVNQSYAINPPTVGVVTLDALDYTGNLYPQASTQVFPADTLTSRVIRLDSLFGSTPKKLTPADSVYFSFYFQPGGGYGNMWERTGVTPDIGDSLVLEFYNSETAQWDHTWSQAGIPLDSVYKDSTTFRHVLLPVLNEDYFSDAFQFRFRNYCSLDRENKPGFSGNCDQWHIDYIRLDTGGIIYNFVYQDIAFVNSAPSLLSKYQAMPARQFVAGDTKDTLQMQITNLYSGTLPSQYQYQIFDQQKNQVYLYQGGFENIPPFILDYQYQNAPVHARPPVDYKFPDLNGKEQTYTVTHTLKAGANTDEHGQNDTITFKQVFENYYAYDDGTAENGYGLITQVNMAKIAYRFVLNTMDTLTSIDIYFNKTQGDGNLIPFYLNVWANKDSKPASELYRSSTTLMPQYDGLNKYVRYVLERDLIVSGTIYVGFSQTVFDFINIGFDRNNNASENIFYNTTGTWEQSFLSGALMMRPNFGVKGRLEQNDKTIANQQTQSFKIYPNPVSDAWVNIVPIHPEMNYSFFEINLYDMLGVRKMYLPFTQKLDVSSLSKGVYILQIVDTKSKKQYSSKLVIAK